LSLALIVVALITATAAPSSAQRGASASEQLHALIGRALAVSVPTPDEAGYLAAAGEYRALLEELPGIDYERLNLDDQVDHDLVEAYMKTRIFEYEDVQSFKVNPGSYISLGATNRLFLRPETNTNRNARAAIAELRRVGDRFEQGKRNLTNPARTWTENAMYQAYYAKMLLTEYVPEAEIPDPTLKEELEAAAVVALEAVEDYERWLEEDLLPRSTRPPTWRPEQINAYQVGKEMLDEYPVDEMIRVAEEDAAKTRAEMEALAKKIHPSGDLRTVWEVMKDEAPPWEGVLPMAQSFVDMASYWLRNQGDHVVTIPDYIDYGARISPPMARRTLSFGGATGGPYVAGRQSGYYILTPLEGRLTPEEAASRIRSYNPYWTHVISYHEWLGHNVQIAAANEHVTRPIRRAYRSSYFSQSWSFYLEKLLPDEGYYDDMLDYQTGLKTHMARLQMRMWRVQRILTKCKMAKGEMTFDEAVQAYIDEIGMEPANSFIEVQRDSQSPSPPGREIIGEMVILDLRDEYERRMGVHYTMKRFHDTLLTYGSIPFKQIERLMFGD
jgi:uncharacterized protein (DUF885 family)